MGASDSALEPNYATAGTGRWFGLEPRECWGLWGRYTRVVPQPNNYTSREESSDDHKQDQQEDIDGANLGPKRGLPVQWDDSGR